MPAFNEEKNLSSSIEMVQEAFRDKEFELIIIDDFSTDQTESIGLSFSSKFENIFYFKNDKNIGRGGAILRGYEIANKEFSIVIQGKKDTTAPQIIKILSSRKEEDITLTYQLNFNERPFSRRVLSSTFTKAVNLLMGFSIKYYNGSAIIRTKHLKNISVDNYSYSLDAEIIINLLHSGLSYNEVGVVDIFEKGRESRALSISNFFGVCLFFIRILSLRVNKTQK